MTSSARYRGVFPVVPTTFTPSGELDLTSQLRCVDFMIDAGSNGLCILANFSEQFVLADEEREVLTKAILEHVAGRVPVIVTTTHFSTRVCVERSRRAAARTAPPPTKMERCEKLPRSARAAVVSPSQTSTRRGSMLSSPAARAARAALEPVPQSTVPVARVSVPSSLRRSNAVVCS